MIQVTTGNFLEMYDFLVFGYYAAAIGRTFFPKTSEFASLMLSFATFGVGFLIRPFGAVILGAYVDRRGRRKGLILTLTLMSIGTLSIACVPGYAAIGLAAPLLVVVGRMLQGFSAGVETGQRIGLPRRDRHTGQPWPLRELAKREPTVVSRVQRGAGRGAPRSADAGPDGRGGRAGAAAGGMPVDSGPIRAANVAG